MINVSELIHDPDFATEITVVRRTKAKLDHGRATVTESEFKTIGIVQPATAEQLQQLSNIDVSKPAETLSLYVLEKLTAGNEQGEYSDLLRIKGHDYACLQVEDFSRHGYYHALASRDLDI